MSCAFFIRYVRLYFVMSAKADIFKILAFARMTIARLIAAAIETIKII